MAASMDRNASVKRQRTSIESWCVPSSFMAKNTHNPIRKIVDGMKLTPNPEKEMIALSIGDPTVFGNMKPCIVTTKAVCDSVQSTKNNGYVPSVGQEDARKAVAEYYSRPTAPLTSKDIILCSGCSGALDLCISVLANEGQNILVPRPGFSLYKTLADSLGINVKHYDLLPERNWEVNLEHLESMMDDQTAAIVVNNPSNPCGSVYSQQHIREILAVCERNKMPIISDEIYADFVFSGHESISMATETSTVPILACGGLTKRWIVPGWRMGWIMIHDRNNVFQDEVRPGLVNLSQRILGPNTIIQGGLRKILEETPQSYFDEIVGIVEKNAKITYNLLRRIPGLKPIMPSGAMYMMVGIDITKFSGLKNDVVFTEKLVTEQSVFALPAQCFQYPNYFRVVLTLPEEKVREACERIQEFCEQHSTESMDVTNGDVKVA